MGFSFVISTEIVYNENIMFLMNLEDVMNMSGKNKNHYILSCFYNHNGVTMYGYRQPQAISNRGWLLPAST